ncbi:hypothetical protein MPSEU_000860200 [Mayamaea pseudoterrestris]|nr:hypothetical protein MPSEU_000860200 [Mayamaea pseudoterrestris]
MFGYPPNNDNSNFGAPAARGGGLFGPPPDAPDGGAPQGGAFGAPVAAGLMQPAGGLGGGLGFAAAGFGVEDPPAARPSFGFGTPSAAADGDGVPLLNDYHERQQQGVLPPSIFLFRNPPRNTQAPVATYPCFRLDSQLQIQEPITGSFWPAAVFKNSADDRPILAGFIGENMIDRIEKLEHNAWKEQVYGYLCRKFIHLQMPNSQDALDEVGDQVEENTNPFGVMLWSGKGWKKVKQEYVSHAAIDTIAEVMQPWLEDL